MQRTGDELLERLELMRIDPELIVDLGAGTGRMSAALTARFASASIISVDASLRMLQFGQAPRVGLVRRLMSRRTSSSGAVQADAGRLPLADASVDLVVSNLMLHCCDPVRVLGEVRRVLKPEGALLFSTFGPDTLRELNSAWLEVGADRRVLRFMDMHDLGDIMLKAGLVDPVVDMDNVTLTYPDTSTLWRDLRSMGSRNVRMDRSRTLTGPRRFAALEQVLIQRFRTDGLIRMTAELVYANAWAKPVNKDRNASDSGLKVEFQAR